MPGRNGVELAEELRMRFPTISVAVATANVQDEVIDGDPGRECDLRPPSR